MSHAEQRRAAHVRLTALRREGRARVATLRRQAQARVDALPAVRAEKRARWRRRGVGAVLLLLLLFLRCECDPAVQGAPVAVVAEVEDAGVTPPRRPPPKRRPSTERLGTGARPGYETGTQRSPAWLDDFRLQVAARSPRLAQCFQGADRPGALRWNVALNPESGAVSDHVFEPVAAAELSEAQRGCVQRVLSTPGYRVAGADLRSVPPRVSLVIEF